MSVFYTLYSLNWSCLNTPFKGIHIIVAIKLVQLDLHFQILSRTYIPG